MNILLVDDKNENLIALEALLRHDDHSIFMAQSGSEALELLLTRQDFAVALIDIQMPEMNGFELAELMRAKSLTREIPIIFVTAAYHDQNFSFKGYEAGAVDVLFKPINPVVLQAKVRVFLQMAKQREELQSQLAKLKQTEAELQKALAVRDEFMGIASHELRTPITSMKLQLHLLQRIFDRDGVAGLSSERLAKFFSTSSRQIKNLADLISDLMDVTRISNGRLTLRPEEIDLNHVIADVLEEHHELISNAGNTVHFVVEQDAMVFADRTRLEQMIANLVSNACKYAAGKNIEIFVRRAAGFAELSVIDHGPGIPNDKISKIFERFERVNDQGSVKGLGLGLYIVRQIVLAHGGTIRVQSEVGKGTNFIIEIPTLDHVKSLGSATLTAAVQQA